MIVKSLVVIGGGISGIEACLSASKNMDNILLVETNNELGGYFKLNKNNQLFKKYNVIKSSLEYLDERIELIKKTNVEIMTSTFVSNITKEKEQYVLTLINSDGVTFVKSRLIINASGSENTIKNSLFMSGLNKAGVFTIRQLYLYISKYGISPSRNASIYSLKDINEDTINILKDNGIIVSSYLTPYKVYDKELFNRLNIPVYERVEIKKVNGIGHVESLTIDSDSKTLEIKNIDSLVFMDELSPNSKIWKMVIDNESDLYKFDQSYLSKSSGLFVTGDSMIPGLSFDDTLSSSKEVGYNASKYRIQKRRLIDINKSLNIKYLSPNILDLNLPLNDIKFYVVPDIYCNDMQNRKFKIFKDNEPVIIREIDNFNSISKPLSFKIDLSDLNLSDDSQILVTIE